MRNPSDSENLSGNHQGAQAVDRALNLLKQVARHHLDGARLSDLTTDSGLSRPTVHRLLQSLVSAGFVRQNENRRYELGTTLYELGLAAPSPVERLRELRPVIEELAEASGDTAFLAVRRGDEMLYLVRAEGSFPVRVHIIREGDRLPLPVSASGICLMAGMAEMDVNTIFDRRAADENFPWASETVIRQLIQQVKSDGYLLGENTVAPGVTGLGIAVPSAGETPYLGISVSAISSRVTPARIPKLVSMLRAASSRIAGILNR